MTNKVQIENYPVVKSHKMTKLILGLIFDAIGMISFAIPFLAEVLDVVWAPISGILLTKMYKGYTGKIAGMVGFLEEILPGTDVIPTFTLTWIYVYIVRKEQ